MFNINFKSHCGSIAGMAFVFKKEKYLLNIVKELFLVKALLCFTILMPVFIPGLVKAQSQFSISTDLSILRNFDGKQPFTVPGQTVAAQWHPDKKYAVYGYYTYHWNGKYANTLRADAKQSSTQPQSFDFLNRSEMTLHHLSVGVKKYLLGSIYNEDRLMIYVSGGFGLIFGKATNNFSLPVDTSLYTVQDNVIAGRGRFKRLTFDISGGAEYPVGYAVFFFSEARLLIPTTDYPSSYLLKNNNAPLLGSINIGLRILFNDDRD